MRILVCGSRSWADSGIIAEALAAYIDPVIIQGGAAGADWIAKTIAEERNLKCETFWADWRNHGRSAGARRNQRMLDEGKPDVVLAFPLQGSVGTWDMVKRARKAGVPVKVWGE